MRMLTKEQIEQYLAEMDAELAEAGLTGEIVKRSRFSSAMETIRVLAPYDRAEPTKVSSARQVNDILRLRTPSFAEVIRTREP